MADANEVSYQDAFAAPVANQNPPPPVPFNGKSEYGYQEAYGAQEKPSLIKQALMPSVSSGNILDNLSASGSAYQSVANIASAFGEGVKQTGDDIGKNLSAQENGGELVESMKKAGMFQPYVEDQKDFDKGFFYKTAYPAIHNMIAGAGEVAVRGVAAAANVGMLPLNAIGGALGQAAEELPEGGVKELAQYALNSPLLADLHLPIRESLQELGNRVPRPVAEGEASGVVGTTEGQNAGVEPLTADQHIRQAVAENEVNPVVSPAAPVEDTSPSERTIHDNARVLDPETFGKYDQLAVTRDQLRAKLAENPDDVETKQQIYQTNSEMRDLAPKVSNAYLQAEQFDRESESIPNPEISIEPPQEMKDELAKRETISESPIAHDIAQKLTALGRPADEAQASGEVAARMYQYFADVYGGAKGTAQDWYEREGADVVAGKERSTILAQPKEGGTELNQFATKADEDYAKKQGQLANLESRIKDETNPDKLQDLTRERDLTSKWLDNNSRELEQNAKGKIRLATDDASATISLMKSADASTFVHESSHHFLDMMDRFSKEEDAPQALKDDMGKIRKWTGLSEKAYETPKEKRAYTQAQEKFARGFERYLMEGVAPSGDMALVFAKFKNWLTSIYKTVFNIPNQRGSINEDVRAFFDRVMSTKPDRIIIAKERPPELALEKNIQEPKLKDLFGNVPQPPKSLTEFLASKGGLKDEEGDVKAMGGDKAHYDAKTGKPRPFAKKLINPEGMTYDEAGKLAGESGYFPEKGGERPDINELKDKIGEDLNGTRQYSDKDHEALTNHLDALKYSAEADRIANETGIDPTGKTHDQFWNEVENYYHDEKRYKESQEMASEAQDAYREVERKQKEFMESRGDAWEAPKAPKTRTLEDIENERKQEQAADDALSVAANPQEPRGNTGVSQPSETSIRQSGGGDQPDGRGNAAQGAAEDANLAAARAKLDAARANVSDAPVGDTNAPEPKPATKPNEPTAKSEFIDKAGNIRLDLLTDSDSVKAAMREAAAKNPQIFNHGVITDAQVSEFADAMGADARDLNIQKLREISVNDDIPLAARIRSGSQMMVDALNHSLELMNKENPTDEDAAKFLEAKNQFMMIAETVSATTNEMGRGLRAYANLKKEYNVTDMNELTELFQRMTGRTLDQVKAEMKAGSLLKTPKQLAKYTQDSMKPDFMDKLLEYRNNSLLSGPVTHTFYTAGGFLNAAYKPLQTLSGIGVQAIRELGGGEVTERMYAQEAAAQFHALGYGSMRGLKVAAESWKRGEEIALPKEISSAPLLASVEGMGNIKGTAGMGWLLSHQAIDGKLGDVINVPSRVIRSIHSFLKTLNYQQNMAGLAVREAMDKGLTPGTDEYAKYIADTIDNPSPKMMDAAGSASLKEVYCEKVDYNSLPGKVFNIVNSNPATKVLFPFIKMQYNIKRLAFRDNSVLGFFSPDIRADVAGINGDVAKNMAIGKIAAGTAVAGLGVSMTMQGLNNGGGPSDPKAYKTWRLTHTPYAVQVGSIVIPHKAMGTLGQLLGWSADMAEGAHEFNPDDIEKSAWQFVRKSAAIFTEEGFLTQAKNTLDAAFTPSQFGTRFIQNFATQWLPFSVGASQMNRLLNDPYSRRVKSLGAENLWGVPEAMEYKYPGTSDLLQPNRDMFGQPITFDSSYDKYANDPVVQKLESLQSGIGRLNDKIKGVQLTEQQYDDYSRIAGQMTYARLSKIVGMSGFDKMPPQHQLQLIEKTTSECRLLAANTIMKMNPEITRQAIAKKRLSIYGNPAINEAEQNQTEDVQNP